MITDVRLFAKPDTERELLLQAALGLARSENKELAERLERYRLLSERLSNTLTEIYGFMSPEDITLPDGRRFEFCNPATEREMLRGLSDAIRSIPKRIENRY